MSLDLSFVNAKHFLCANGLSVYIIFALGNCVFSATVKDLDTEKYVHLVSVYRIKMLLLRCCSGDFKETQWT